MSDHAANSHPDAQDQISQLRDQVQTLMNERVSPALAQASDAAKQYASDAREMYEDQAEALSEKIRDMPLLAILVATGVGYILGRIAR